MGELSKRIKEDLDHDANAPWWVAKRFPGNLFESAPVFFTIVLVLYVLVAASSVIAIVMRGVS